jgi:hypothetical protein
MFFPYWPQICVLKTIASFVGLLVSLAASATAYHVGCRERTSRNTRLSKTTVELADKATFEALHRKGDATCPRSRSYQCWVVG